MMWALGTPLFFLLYRCRFFARLSPFFCFLCEDLVDFLADFLGILIRFRLFFCADVEVAFDPGRIDTTVEVGAGRDSSNPSVLGPSRVASKSSAGTCHHRVEWQYYAFIHSSGKDENPLGICAFCGCELQAKQTEELKQLLAQEDKRESHLQETSLSPARPIIKIAGPSKRNRSESAEALKRSRTQKIRKLRLNRSQSSLSQSPSSQSASSHSSPSQGARNTNQTLRLATVFEETLLRNDCESYLINNT